MILVLMGVAYLAFRIARMKIPVHLITVRILAGRLFVHTYPFADGFSALRGSVEGIREGGQAFILHLLPSISRVLLFH